MKELGHGACGTVAPSRRVVPVNEPWWAPTERQVMLSAERPREKNVAGQAAVGN